MDTLPLNPELSRHGQSVPAALDEIVTSHLEWEAQDQAEALEGIHEGIEDMNAGRMDAAEEVFKRLRVKHGLPG